MIKVINNRKPHPQTIITLDRLADADWFSQVGIKDLNDAIVLNSWEEAVSSASNIEWENIGLEASNVFRERILAVDKSRLNQWNEITECVKEFSNALVHDKLAEAGLPKIIMNCVQWDILGLCMEAEYADIVPPGFYHAIAFYYLKGHFPCGIQGDPASGTMIVF